MSEQNRLEEAIATLSQSLRSIAEQSISRLSDGNKNTEDDMHDLLSSMVKETLEAVSVPLDDESLSLPYEVIKASQKAIDNLPYLDNHPALQSENTMVVVKIENNGPFTLTCETYPDGRVKFVDDEFTRVVDNRTYQDTGGGWRDTYRRCVVLAKKAKESGNPEQDHSCHPFLSLAFM